MSVTQSVPERVLSSSVWMPSAFSGFGCLSLSGSGSTEVGDKHQRGWVNVWQEGGECPQIGGSDPENVARYKGTAGMSEAMCLSKRRDDGRGRDVGIRLLQMSEQDEFSLYILQCILGTAPYTVKGFICNYLISTFSGSLLCQIVSLSSPDLRISEPGLVSLDLLARCWSNWRPWCLLPQGLTTLCVRLSASPSGQVFVSHSAIFNSHSIRLSGDNSGVCHRKYDSSFCAAWAAIC